MVDQAGRSWQREFDDLKYALVGLERLLTLRKVTGSAVDQLRDRHDSVNRELRNTIDPLLQAREWVQYMENVLLELEFEDSSQSQNPLYG